MSYTTTHLIPLALGVALLLSCPLTAAAEPTTTMVSVSSSGEQGNSDSSNGYATNNISADGRYIAFATSATNLATGDTNGEKDIYVHDRQTGQNTRVSVNSDGTQGNGDSAVPSISRDGRYVSFYSNATNLVTGDSNNKTDIFVHDRQTSQTTRVSVNSTGDQGNGYSYPATISADGRYVVFCSSSSTLVTFDSNNASDIFLRDRQTNTTTLVSKALNSKSPGNGNSIWSAISGDGRYVAFSSSATNLVSNDTNGQDDIFVHDRQTGTTRLVSVNATGSSSGNNWSEHPAISQDGRYVAFASEASNLIANDTNNKYDVFARDLTTGQTTRVSLDANGNERNLHSIGPVSISADGLYISYFGQDVNDAGQIFVYDREAQKTTLVSVNTNGTMGGDDNCNQQSITANGKFITFSSSASNLVAQDTNGYDDVFVRGPLYGFPWPMFLPALTGEQK